MSSESPLSNNNGTLELQTSSTDTTKTDGNPMSPLSNQPAATPYLAMENAKLGAGNDHLTQPSKQLRNAPDEGSDKKDSSKVTEIHVQALDEIVSVNSFFTVAVFIGLSFTNPSAQNSLVTDCLAGQDYTKFLVVFEVIAFASYLLSSLIAQGLKLLIVMINSKDHPQPISARIHPQKLRLAMIVCAAGTVVGTAFLTLSIVILIQIRLGLLSCETSSWSKWAAIPVIIMVCSGLTSFISTAFYAFLH